jgi:LuxR family maltose regulon positive regulatory protein
MAAALVHLDRVDTDRAAAHLAEADVQNRRRTSSVAYFDLQRTLDARRSTLVDGPVRALAVLRLPAASAQEPAVLASANRALQARLLIGARELPEARALLDNASDIPGLEPARIDLALADGDLTGARAHLDAWKPCADDRRTSVGRLLRETAVADAEGNRRAARDSLRAAIAGAEAEHLRWPFLEVPSALRLLQSAERRSALINDTLVRAARRLDSVAAIQAQLIEPLTDRELTVLAYLPGRFKNHEIAAELYVSVNTLKSHLRNIYRKLEVADRDEAVAKATDIGLL